MHKIAKLLLETADSPECRVDAVKKAMELGMPLQAIQEYLDWLDFIRQTSVPPKPKHESAPKAKSKKELQ